MGKITFEDLGSGHGELHELPDGYVTLIESGDYIIFMERAGLLSEADACATLPLALRGRLSFTRTRNNSRTERSYDKQTYTLLRQAQEASYRVYEKAVGSSTSETGFTHFEFNDHTTNLKDRKQLIMHAEFIKLGYQARRGYRQTKYFAAPKSSLELMWRYSGCGAPLDFFSNVVRNGSLITSTSQSLYRATRRNSFSTNALSGTANSKPYRNARANAHIVYTPVFERLISEHSEKWRNHESNTATYDKGRKACMNVIQAINSAEQRTQNLGIKITSQQSTMECDLFKSKPSRAASLLLEWSWSANFESLHHDVGNADTPMERGWTGSVLESGGFLNSLRRGMREGQRYDLSQPTEDDWEEAQSFFDNHDDLCVAAGIGFNKGDDQRLSNNATKEKYRLPKTRSQYLSIIEGIEEQENTITRNSDSIRSFLQMTLREMRDRMNQIGSGYVERAGVRVQDT